MARLFSIDSERTTNAARKAIYSWDIEDIMIEVNTNTIWESPVTHQKYAMEQRVILGGAYPADLTITMVRTNQEIVIAGNSPIVKYEGEAAVTGMLNNASVSGWAFMELQPMGRL